LLCDQTGDTDESVRMTVVRMSLFMGTPLPRTLSSIWFALRMKRTADGAAVRFG
jgi:hypothetical protein